MNIKPIKNEQDYANTLSLIEHLMSAKPNTPQMDALEVLTTLVEAYEEQFYKIDAPDPIEAIKFRMEQEGLKQKDLVAIVGSKSRVSEILNRKRKLTIQMIRNFHTQLHIPVESLFLDYKINSA
ncbi:MAG: DNA-binding protein [Sulfurimonas sp.]|uniref:helix-turn-helix domain-containing protein n=1 Tax=Sulfurimonas sp. TaxID=2022749 RepID=UPI0025FB2E7B|nr:DNA-binding protein [Sulfurimonas sp.]MCK9455660.1 DNA-binding protein [Sulfurimonas sp.]